MSELKAINAYQLTTNTEDSDVFIHNDEFGCGGDLVECYLKSEADKVIAEKDKEIAELKSEIADLRDDKKSTDAILDERNAELAKLQAIIEDRDKTIAELQADYKEACDRLQTANLIKDEQLAATRHSKHKRCLNKAEWCEERCARYDLLQEHSSFSWRREIDFYFRWYQRWLDLADKFSDKEAK